MLPQQRPQRSNRNSKGAAAASRPVLLDEEQEEQVIGVKVLNNAPDPRMANKNLGKSHHYDLIMFFGNSCGPHRRRVEGDQGWSDCRRAPQEEESQQEGQVKPRSQSLQHLHLPRPEASLFRERADWHLHVSYGYDELDRC